VTALLLKAVPELQERYRRELDLYAGEVPGQYVVFGFVLKPYLRNTLASHLSPPILKRVFSFFEEMATSLDIEVVNLLQVGIFETLVGEPNNLATAWRYMGEETKKIACETARTRRCEQNLPTH
jgi:hypothetical protein